MEIEVAIPTPLNQTFTYKHDVDVQAGTRVLVPFGSRRVVGVALGKPLTAPSQRKAIQLKSIESVIDEAPIYTDVILKVARWMSSYYLHPIGEVLRTMLPAGVSKVVRDTCTMTEKGRKATAMHRTDEGDTNFAGSDGDGATDLLHFIFGKRTRLTVATTRAKIKKWQNDHPGGPKLDFQDLVTSGFVSVCRGSTVRARTSSRSVREYTASTEAAGDFPQLTHAQRIVFDRIQEIDRNDPCLLLGVTGSGKTEIYLRLIQDVLRQQCEPGCAKGQCLVLVPEISLTPQMTRIFANRFPGEVAVVHSAMTDTDRWSQLESIRYGQTRILIGPRSAVFGPFQNLRLIIVDEEHDQSYKQGTGLTYHGRDIAILRGKMEGARVLLGSATPSLESYQNALTGKYRLLELPDRVGGRPLPEIRVVPSQPAYRKGANVIKTPKRPANWISTNTGDDDSLPIDGQIIEALRENYAHNHQAIVLVNRRGYAYYLFSVGEKKAVQCPNCSISLTLHRRSTVLQCHYCDYKIAVKRILESRKDETFVAVGYGSEKAEDCLQKVLADASIARLDSDTASKKNVLAETLAKFRETTIDVLVGTQILAKGHDFPGVTLIVILEVDQQLSLPDFRAGERTYQLIVQAAGRAGRAENPGRVLIQCMRPNHQVVLAAIRQDYKAFATGELELRQAHGYPPFSRIVAVEYNSQDVKKLGDFTDRVDRWLNQASKMRPDWFASVKVLGPTSPPISIIRGRHRRTLLFMSKNAKLLHDLSRSFSSAFQRLPGDIRLKIDVDPQNLI